jgi:hypothetical protein
LQIHDTFFLGKDPVIYLLPTGSYFAILQLATSNSYSSEDKTRTTSWQRVKYWGRKVLAERFGKIIQLKERVSISRNDTSVSKSGQLDFAIPASKIATLSSGEFVGMVADDPQQKITLKSFHCEIINDKNALQLEEKHFKELPVISNITQEMVLKNYYRIKKDIEELIETEIEILQNTPGKESLFFE